MALASPASPACTPSREQGGSSPYVPYDPDSPGLLPDDSLLAIANVKRVAIVGTGLIGSGWAAVFLARGFDVTAYVRSAQSEAKFLAFLERAWHKLLARGVAAADAADGWRAVRCVRDIAEAVSDADYVQESVVEHMPLKQNILAQIAAHARPQVLVGTSSSFIPRSLAAALVSRAHCPERIVTAHPTLPHWDGFVEVYGGSAGRTAWLAEFFGPDRVRMDVVALRRQYHGHVLNAFNNAIGTTALALVNGGVCSADDVDQALVHLGGMFVSAGGLSGAMVGVVGGGSEQAALELSRDIVLGAPLAWSACLIEWICGQGLAARCALLLVRQCHGWYLRSEWVRRKALRLVELVSTPLSAPYRARWEAGGTSAFEKWTLARTVALEQHVLPL